MFHLALHFLVPLVTACVFFRQHWIKTFVILLATMLIDLDHLLATPVYDPMRCSIGYHPLHGPVPIGVYLLMMLFPKTRIIGIGLSIHIALDALDCRFTSGVWFAG